ncbi:MAG: aminotransferase class I/II-fold pyridoxal phosphate-dependent enzyme, partial [Spirochaetota bacterium]
MIDIKRKVPRFDITFMLQSNAITGKGVNISQKGVGFLVDEELVPAANIPFSTVIEGFIFSKKTYTLKGVGKLLFSNPAGVKGYYNGFEFAELDQKSKENLLELLDDILRFQKSQMSELKNKTLADFLSYPSDDVFSKAELFYNTLYKKITSDLHAFSYYLDSASTSTACFIHKNSKERKDMVMLGGSNYLALTTHPDVIKAGIEALQKYGTGSGSGSMVGGTLSIHQRLEEELADFTGKEAVMLFNSGYSTNIGVFSGLMRPADVVISDQFNHASILDGCILSGTKTLMFSHNKISSLKRMISRAKFKYNGLMIAVNGVYSADGSLAPLAEIARIAKTNDCRVMVDEAHAFGVLGEKGVGAAEFNGCIDNTDIIMASMSKALAGTGGFIASTKEVIAYLRYYAHSYLFSSAIPPASAASALKALQIIRKDGGIREQLFSNIRFFTAGLKALNLEIGDPKAAIVPLFIPDLDRLVKVSNRLFEKGIFHNLIAYPAVPMGGSLLRFRITSGHSENELT